MNSLSSKDDSQNEALGDSRRSNNDKIVNNVVSLDIQVIVYGYSVSTGLVFRWPNNL